VHLLGGWGILIDAILALAVIITLFVRSQRDRITSANAMSEVAESGRAVKVKRNPPPTRRQRRLARDAARAAKESERTSATKEGEKK